MVSFAELIEFEPASLRTAAERWRGLAGQLADQQDQLRTRVEQRLEAPVWEGTAADAARAYVGRRRAAFTKQADRLTAVGAALDGAADGFAAAKATVLDAVAAAGRHGFAVGSDGSVTPSVAALRAGPDVAVVMATAAGLDATIRSVLASATKLDTATAATLEQLSVDGDGTGGPDADGWPGGLGDRADEQTMADAERAVELATKGPLTPDELAELDGLLTSYAGDSLFATTFFEQLGPAGTLDFLAVLANQGNGYTAESADAAGALQGQLSDMLAIATDESSPAHLDDQWTAALLGQADRTFQVAGASPTGYQLIGVLLHGDAEFSAGFLNQFGEAAIAYENGNATVWTEGMDVNVRLNFIDEHGVGWDPMTGLMSALGNNGEAAAALFDPAAHQGRIEYLLEDRALLIDDVDQVPFDPQQRAYFDMLGTALDSATTIDYSDPDAPAAHTPLQASIVTETVHVLGSADHLNGNVPAVMRDSVANILADYVADVNHAVGHPDGGTLRLDGDGQPVDLAGGWDTPWSSGEGHALFDATELTRVIGDTARDPDAYVTMYDAERAYTALVLDYYAAADSGADLDQRAAAVEFQAKTSGTVFGILDGARADAIADGGEAADKAYNDAVSRGAQVTNWLVGELVDGLPPLVDKGVGWAVNELFGLAEQDSGELTAGRLSALYGDGRAQAADLAFQAMWNNQLWPPDHPPPAILLPGGEPADLNNLTEAQWDALQSWMYDIGYTDYMGQVVREVDDSYTVGRTREDEADGEN